MLHILTGKTQTFRWHHMMALKNMNESSEDKSETMHTSNTILFLERL